MGEDKRTKGNKKDNKNLTVCIIFNTHIKLVHDFCDGLEHQTQFQDRWLLKTLEREGAGFFRLAHNCLSHKQCLNLSWSASPMTWENSTSNALFYQSCPSQSDSNNTWDPMTAIKFQPFFKLIHLIDDAKSTKVTLITPNMSFVDMRFDKVTLKWLLWINWENMWYVI